jgi:hypothetical protein
VAGALGELSASATPLGHVAIKGYDRAIQVWRLA